MTHRGPFQPLLFCDSVILILCHRTRSRPREETNPSQLRVCQAFRVEAGDRWQMCHQRVNLSYQIHPAEAVLKAGVNAAKAARAPAGCKPNLHVVPTRVLPQRERSHMKSRWLSMRTPRQLLCCECTRTTDLCQGLNQTLIF